MSHHGHREQRNTPGFDPAVGNAEAAKIVDSYVKKMDEVVTDMGADNVPLPDPNEVSLQTLLEDIVGTTLADHATANRSIQYFVAWYQHNKSKNNVGMGAFAAMVRNEAKTLTQIADAINQTAIAITAVDISLP